MKNKLLIIIPILILSLCLLSCKKNEEKDYKINDFVNYVYQSEEKLAGYYETNSIKDNGIEVYYKSTDLTVRRKDMVRTDVSTYEKILSLTGGSLYDETYTSYKTIDNVMYTEVNGKVYESNYEVPTYFLTFVLSEEFLEEGYTITKEDDAFILSGNVLESKVSSLFINKSVNTVKGLSIKIVIKDDLLQSFNCTYVSTKGFDVEMNTKYYYGSVGKAKAVFYLEGGQCQNSKDRVSYIYEFDGSRFNTLIADPNVLETDELDLIVKDGYHIEGWYQNKKTNPDGTVLYTDKWDFDHDRMDINGVTLYAKWEIDKVYSYELYYYDSNNNEVLLDSYEVNEGEKFYDIFLDKTTVDGYTSLGYVDENGNPWDDEFTHPGGETDTAIKIYLNLIEGDYQVVRTSGELSSAISRNADIYLMNDIDFEGKAISFNTYKGKLEGNGYKLYNFEIYYNPSRSSLKGSLDDLTGSKDHLYISLFFELKDAEINNLTFDDVSLEISTSLTQTKYIIVAPLAILMSNTKLENVKFDGELVVKKIPDGCELDIVYDNFWYSASNDVIVDEDSKLEFSSTN